MNRTAGGYRGLALAAAALAVLGSVVMLCMAQNGEPRRRGAAERREEPCVFRSIPLMPVTDAKALGYSNNSRFVLDSAGTATIVVRSKHDREHSICLVRAAGPWRTGMPLELTWLEDRDSLQFSAQPQRPAGIAAGGDGSIHMAWYGGRAGSPDHQIRYARFTTAGRTVLAEVRAPFTVPGLAAVSAALTTPTELWQEHAAIAVGPDGTVHVAWEARDPFRLTAEGMPRPGIAVATRSRDGAWSVSGALGRPPYLDVGERFPAQSRPAILVDGSGLAHVLCYGSVRGVQQVLYGNTRGGGFSGWKAIAPSPGDQRHVTATLDALGRVHVAWREGAAPSATGAPAIGIYYSVRETDGRWHRPTRVSAVDENASTPAIGVGDSSVSVAWIAWSPGALDSDGLADNGFPADNSTVDGRLEVSSSPLDHERFESATVLDPGRASYPCWAVRPASATGRPPLVWTSADTGGRVMLRLGWCERAH
jgi:hypothetical protein